LFYHNNISKVFEQSEVLPFDDTSKIVLLSECHRGDGSWADDFSRNKNIYYSALKHYYDNGFIYIEIGDGDELWENPKMSDITDAHGETFELLSKFHEGERLYCIYGNHDIVKRNKDFEIPILKDLKFHEGLILKEKDTDNKIFLIHGHQVDFLNYRLWRLSRASVRFIWKPLELFGVNDFTSPAKNYKKKRAVGRRLSAWVDKERHILIAGHTHLPTYPEVGETPYFNDGSCVHPNGIVAIEISGCCITLVKWLVKVRDDGVLAVARQVIRGPRRLSEYFIND
jgi:UDP-2,3-diacylglucosamine pyrophosphatase LpxH